MSASGAERRRDLHREAMVDVAVVLQRAYGTDYAVKFLSEMNIPQAIIDRLLSFKVVQRNRRPRGAAAPA